MIKFRYVYSNGKEIKSRIYTIEEIENKIPYFDTKPIMYQDFKLISRDRFTEKLDKNGIEIFERDICKVLNYASDYLKRTGKMKCTIKWSNTAGFYGRGFGVPTGFAMGEVFEIISNTHIEELKDK